MISLLHKGKESTDNTSDWRPVVLLDAVNQLLGHIVNQRLRDIVEKAGILEPGQGGYREHRSTDINTAKMRRLTIRAKRQTSFKAATASPFSSGILSGGLSG